MADSVSGGLELVGNSCCEHVCHQGVMPSHDANNDDAEMMIKRKTKALQIEMPTLFRYVLCMYVRWRVKKNYFLAIHQ